MFWIFMNDICIKGKADASLYDVDVLVVGLHLQSDACNTFDSVLRILHGLQLLEGFFVLSFVFFHLLPEIFVLMPKRHQILHAVVVEKSEHDSKENGAPKTAFPPESFQNGECLVHFAFPF